jgi:hypothetical protein
VSDVVDLRPLRLSGAKTFAELAVWSARKNVMNRASKNVHYNRGIRSVNSLFGFYFPTANQCPRRDVFDKTREFRHLAKKTTQ